MRMAIFLSALLISVSVLAQEEEPDTLIWKPGYQKNICIAIGDGLSWNRVLGLQFFDSNTTSFGVVHADVQWLQGDKRLSWGCSIDHQEYVENYDYIDSSVIYHVQDWAKTTAACATISMFAVKNKWEFAFRFGLGVNVVLEKRTNSKYGPQIERVNPYVMFSAQYVFTARYILNEYWGLFAETGIYKSAVQGGITYRILH